LRINEENFPKDGINGDASVIQPFTQGEGDNTDFVVNLHK
jgi:hypothetical protein